MNKKLSILSAITLGAIMSLALVIPTFAISDNANATNAQQGQTNSTNGSDNSNKPTSADKLSADKQQICTQNENRIQKLFSNMNQLGEKQLNLFSQISDKVRTFYTNSGLTVENYEQLVNNVESKYTAAQTTLRTMTQTSSQFGCDKDDPKGVASQYKVQVRTQIQELKDYRTAVSDLISAVKTAAEVSEEE